MVANTTVLQSQSIGTNTMASCSNIASNNSGIINMLVLVTKGSDEFTTNVSHNLKQNIVAAEYINLSLLLVNSMSSSNDSQKITFAHGELITPPNLNSIEVWTYALIVVMSVFGSALSENVHELLKHMHLIRLGAKRSTLNWKSYDEQIRIRASQNPSLSWEKMDC